MVCGMAVLAGAGSCSSNTGDPPPPPPSPKLQSITPAVGDLAGGQVVTLRGENLGQVTGVKFGTADALGVTPAATGLSLTCLTPPNARGVVAVSVSGPGGGDAIPNGFSYVRQVTISGVEPARVPANTEQAPVVVRGTGLVPPVTARLTNRGDFSAPAVVDASQSSELAVRVLLPALSVGEYFITVTNGENQIATTPQPLVVTQPIVVTDIDPPSGFADETTFIQISGSGFDGVSAVLLGGAPCGVLVVNPTLITCETPVAVAGPVEVVVRRTPGDETRLANGFTYYATTDATVRVLYADPRNGVSVGGGQTRIAATGLNLGTPTITVGGTPAEVLNVEGGKHAVVRLPPFTVADADVFMKVPISVSVAGNTDTRQNAFTYYIKPEVGSVMPVRGATVGGDLVTLFGRGFTEDNLRVTFDGFEATDVQRLTATRLQCRIPSHAAAVVDVRAYSRFDASEVARGIFEYVQAVRVTALDPPDLSIAGGTIVVATGSGFVPNRMEVTVGDITIPTSNVIRESDTRLRFVAPRQDQAGQVLLSVRDTVPVDPALATGEINVDYVDKTVRVGGVSGGAIRRNISVSVIRQDTGAPVSGAEVFVGNAWGSAQYRGTTDTRGMTVLAASELVGPVTLTAARQGYENQTRVGVDAAEVTFALLPLAPEAGTAPRYATLTGTLANWAQAGLPRGAAAGQVKRIAAIWVSEPDQGLMPPDPGTFNIISEEPGCDISPDGVANPLPTTFTVNAYEGSTVALLAVVYFYNTVNGLCEPGSEQAPNMEGEGLVTVIAGAMGLLTDVEVRPGTNPSLVVPVNRTVTDGMQVTLTGAPVFAAGVGGTARTVDLILDVGRSGIFTFYNPLMDTANFNSGLAWPAIPTLLGLIDFFTVLPSAVPAPGGDLKYIVHGLSGAPRVEQGNLTGLSYPRTDVWRRQVQDITVDLADWFGFPEGMAPVQGASLTNRTFTWTASSHPQDFVTLDIGQVEANGDTTAKWSIIMPGGTTTFTVPSLTGAPNVTDLSSGENLWQLGMFDLFAEDAFNYQDHHNGELGEPHRQASVVSAPAGFNMP